MSTFKFIEAEKERHPVSVSCRVAGVSRAAHYDQRKRTPSKRSQEDDRLITWLRANHKRHKRRSGARWHQGDLRAEGINVSRKRIRRLMRQANLVSRHTRFVPTTTIVGIRGGIPDLVKRDFFAPEPNQTWVGDITYLRTKEGFLYLSLLQDVFSRRIVGWDIADHLRAEGAATALRRALRSRRPPETLVHHTDRGTQYTSVEYQKNLRKLRQSVGRTGVCWDNAMAESIFATVKKELEEREWNTQAEAIRAVRAYIRYYNHQRRHSSLNRLTPVEFEECYAA